MTQKKQIVFCQCANSGIIADEIKKEAFTAVTENACDVIVVPDLCGAAGTEDKRLQELAQHDVTVIACYPRAVRWLFHRAGAPLADDSVILNMKALSADEIIRQIPFSEKGTGASPVFWDPSASEIEDKWIPWFPVIDYDRCVNCRQCASFCLFGTYDTDENGQVRVSSPASCKNNCPACARICPEAAIIFPKLDESPINGDEIRDEEAVKANVQVNVDKLLGNDVYAALAERKKKAQRLRLRKQQVEKAQQERERCKN